MATFLRYHVSLRGRRSTVSLDRVLSTLLALKLGVREEDKAHTAVRAWLQGQIDSAPGAFVQGISQRLCELATLAIAAPSLRERYIDREIERSERHSRARR